VRVVDAILSVRLEGKKKSSYSNPIFEKAHKAQKLTVVERIRVLRVVERIGVLKVEGDGRAKC
jgi:hypothetical protein